jgi:hypothetical protein
MLENECVAIIKLIPMQGVRGEHGSKFYFSTKSGPAASQSIWGLYRIGTLDSWICCLGAYIYIIYVMAKIEFNKYLMITLIYGRCQNYRTEVEEYEGTVIYRTLLFHNSVFLGRYEKNSLS